jgi:hypothetical protein
MQEFRHCFDVYSPQNYQLFTSLCYNSVTVSNGCEKRTKFNSIGLSTNNGKEAEIVSKKVQMLP